MKSAGARAGGEATGIESLGNGYAASSIGSAGTAVCSAISQGLSYMYQCRVMDIQADMQEKQFQFQIDSAEVAKETKIDLIQAEIEKQGIQVEGQKLLNASIVNRAKAEGELAVQKAVKRDAEVTKKTANSKVNKTTIAKMFRVDPRSQPFYGKPVFPLG